MIEPVALGRPTIVGPDLRNFEVISKALIDAGGVAQTDAHGLAGTIDRLLADRGEGRDMVERGRECIRARQGATRRHAELLTGMTIPERTS